MGEDEARKYIVARVVVRRQQVAIAKAVILRACVGGASSESLITEVLRHNLAELPKEVALAENARVTEQLEAIANGLSWRTAAIEAIWSLIHAGLLLTDGALHGNAPGVGWTMMRGGSGTSSGWAFQELHLQFPSTVRRAPSSLGTKEYLIEPDLYLQTVGIPDMHSDVASALSEAVSCFRAELFTASVAMLGKTCEGAWLELGAALLRIIPADEVKGFSKPAEILDDHNAGPGKKIGAVLAIFDRQNVFKKIAVASGVRVQDLRDAANWSDAVRDSRNTVHFGVSSATPNTYEKVAALLLGTAQNFRVLYRLKSAADAV